MSLRAGVTLTARIDKRPRCLANYLAASRTAQYVVDGPLHLNHTRGLHVENAQLLIGAVFVEILVGQRLQCTSDKLTSRRSLGWRQLALIRNLLQLSCQIAGGGDGEYLRRDSGRFLGPSRSTE